jgi:hypothetical protein
MIMRIFRDMPFVRLLLVALAVLLVGGVFVADGALANVDIEVGGGEGDPTDGVEGIVSGGGSGSQPPIVENYSQEIKSGRWISGAIFTIDYENGTVEQLFFLPQIINGQLVFLFSNEWVGGTK